MQNKVGKKFLITLFKNSKEATSDELVMRVRNKGHNLFIETDMSPS